MPTIGIMGKRKECTKKRGNDNSLIKVMNELLNIVEFKMYQVFLGSL